MTSQQPTPDHYDVPFQREFVDKFVQSGIGARQLLIAPPGAGKTTVTVRIVRRLMREGQVTRGLVLCPASLVGQYEYSLSGEEAQPSVLVVDRYRLREWEAAVPSGESPLPDSIIAVMSIDLAKQPDVGAILAATRWDVLVVDEAHLLVGQRATLVRQLMSSGTVGRALLATATPLKEPIFKGLSVTDWTAEIRSTQAASASTIPVRRMDVQYSKPEIIVFNELAGLAALFQRSKEAMRAFVLFARASSSLYALEQTLLRLRNTAAHYGITTEEDLLMEEIEPRPPKGERASPDVLLGVERVLSALEAVECDSKLDSLSRVLTQETDSATMKAILIFSRFADTVEYLTSTLADRGFEVRGVTGSMPVSKRIATIEAAAAGGITVLTLAAVKGCQFGSADSYVFYEQLKEDEFGLYAIRMLGSGRDRPFDVLSFEDPAAPPTVARVEESEV